MIFSILDNMHSKKKVKTLPDRLSIVVPMYNEEQRLNKGFNICREYYDQYQDWEFIFVNDGSTDKTVALIKDKIKGLKRMRLVSYHNNQGKGYALKQGVKKAKKPLVLICDIDFSTPLSELSQVYPLLKKGATVVVGSRKAQGAKVLKHQAVLREWLGTRFTGLCRFWLKLKVTDVTCGFKLFKTKAAKKLFKLSQIRGWGYDAEILFLANKYGFKVVEAAVIWKNDERTKVLIGRDVLRSLKELWLIRWYDWLGRY